MSKNFYKVIIPLQVAKFWGELKKDKAKEKKILILWVKCFESEKKWNFYTEYFYKFRSSFECPSEICKDEAFFNVIGFSESTYWTFRSFIFWFVEQAKSSENFFYDNSEFYEMFEETYNVLLTVLDSLRDSVGFWLYHAEKDREEQKLKKN